MFNFVGKLVNSVKNNFKINSYSYKIGDDPKLNSILSSIYYMDMETIKVERLNKEKTRYNGRIKKRKWEEKRNNEVQEKRTCTEPFERVKRKKMAMLFAYSGVKYYGMQRNPGMKTIEEDLLKALLATKHITDEAFGQIQTIQFQRAARTDKGVSAAMQVVSLKLPDLVDVPEINANLPPEIRVFSIERVTKGFNSKAQCDARTYIYMLPTYAFEHHTKEIENHFEYRVTPETITNVNNVLKKFEGTKNFHNFTSRKEFFDPSSKRYVMSLKCEEPFVANGLEFVIIKVKGQSFMLHQIRKMVGLSLAVVRGLTGEETIDRCWTVDRLDVPTAPGLGLVLDQIHYDRYNKRYGSDGIHKPLVWADVQEELKKFKEDFIYPTIVNVEKDELSMKTWLEVLPLHAYDVRDGDKKPEDDMEADDSDDDDDEEKIVETKAKILETKAGIEVAETKSAVEELLETKTPVAEINGTVSETTTESAKSEEAVVSEIVEKEASKVSSSV